MRFLHHLLFSIFLTLSGLVIFQPDKVLFWFLLGIIFGVIADMDEQHSKVGRHAKPASILLKHRGIVHSMFLPIIVLIPLYAVMDDVLLVYFTLVPFFGHLLLDSLTKGGVKPFAPFSKAKLSGPFKTGSMFDRMMQALWLFLDAALFVVVIQIYLPSVF